MKTSLFHRILAATLVLGAAGAAGSAEAAYRYGNPYDRGHYDRGVDRAVRCESRDGRTRWCRLHTRGGVRLVQQFSDSPCIRGRSWGVRGDSVWVSRGCRARFAASPYGDDRYYGYGRGDRNSDDPRYYDRRYDDRRYDDRRGYYGGSAYGGGYGRVLRCESHDGRYNFCRAGAYADRVQIRRVLSDSRCRLNYSWGYRDGGIWVDNGCRAEFIVQ